LDLLFTSNHHWVAKYIGGCNQIKIQSSEFAEGEKMKNLVLVVLIALVLTACGSPAPIMTPTTIPPTAIPPTAIPPTAIPPTTILPTAIPPTTIPPTAVPPTAIPPQPTETPSPATALPAEAPALDGATLLDTRCSVCHSADRPRQAKKTREQWDQTVTRMVGKGAQLTEAEKTVLLDYLAKTYGP
jgi:hypothetical protein